MPSLEDVLGQIQTETAPLRTATLTNLQRILAGGPASSLPAYAPNRAAIEGQYNVGLEQARSLLPRGGQLNSAILDLGRNRANAVSGLEAAIRGGALNEASRIGFGVTPSMVSGASVADLRALQRKAYEQQRLNQILGNVGQGIGLIGDILSLF